MSHRNFWNSSIKVGGAATQKSEPIPQFGEFHSIAYEATCRHDITKLFVYLSVSQIFESKVMIKMLNYYEHNKNYSFGTS